MTDPHDHDHVRPATAAERGDVAGDARGQPGRLGRGRGALRGLAPRGDRAHPLGRHEPLPASRSSSSATCTAAAGGRSTSSAPAVATRCRCGTSAPTRWSASTSRPRMLELASRLTAAVGAPARWIESRRPATRRTSWTGRRTSLYTGRGSLIWLQDLDAWAAVLAPAARAGRPPRPLRGPPGGVAVRRRRGRPLDRHRLRLLRRPRGVEGLGARVHRPPLARRRRPELEVRPGVDARRGPHRAARAGLRLERVAEHPVDWWGGHGDVRDEERGRIPLSFSVVATRGDA